MAYWIARGALSGRLPRLVLPAALLLALLGALSTAQAQFWFGNRPMPEFANQSPAVWVNSKPLKRADLAGKVVLIEIWTSI